ncbi:ribonuclease R [Rhizomicrobium palustre]|uniref:Ribonuclease R n=1 Tax=Rhizomicrobium palustre TaxID=189966 RepID=A0A846N5A3_9PROT|nr:ribonuclease R [Rhizomicrobium palustre]NIK90362.1 ribonuclease R [Rhizomicrobium palustre]
MARGPAKNAPPIDRQRVLDVLASEPGATKRDIAKLLGIKGSDRIILKRILKELEGEGVLTGSRRRGYNRPGMIPEVAVLEITGQDPDGELLARPMKWEGEETPPRILILTEDAIGLGERVLARLKSVDDGFEAKVIKRLGASVHKVLGVLKISGSHIRIQPIDRKSKSEFNVDKRDLNGAEDNDLVIAEPLSGRTSGFPRARVVETIGSMDAPKAVSLIAIHAHGIPTDFPKEVIAEAEAALPVDPRGRTDLRAIPLLTIDPEDARDHDDAVWAAPDEDPSNKGGYVTLVAIADVAHYVTPGSDLDREAYKRGNSVYFPDRVVPMLPEKLSADLCSLKEGVDRPCMAVRMVFDANGRKRHHEFLRGTMRSAARLTYAQAQRAFDGHPDADMSATVKKALADVWGAYLVLLKEREHRDPLELDLPERRIKIGEDGKIASIAFKERLESMKLIEEFMVLANVAAAETLEKVRTPLIYRVHEPPSKEKLFGFSDYLRTIGMTFAKGQVMKPGVFNRILGNAKEGPHELVMNDVVLRTQSQAIYDNVNLGHFGLNLAKYAHFTSPIRRYADLIVHRALIRGLKLGDGALSDKEAMRLHEIAEHISMTERRAMAAERDSTDRYVAAFMEDRVGATFSARVTGVTRFGLFVRLADTGAEGLLPVRALGTEFFQHDERRHALIGDRSGTAYSLGDILTVRLAEAAPLTGGLRFDLAEANEAPRVKRRGAPIRPRSKRRR